jgi:DNA-binding MarR family transcriptional regulator
MNVIPFQPEVPADVAAQEDAELAILENIYASARMPGAVRQRDLAAAAGASLGMTNAILKRLAQKGMIAVRKLNSRNVHYAITPDGVNEIARRSYRYFKRTIKNVVFYRDRIDEAVSRAKIRGLQAVLLIGVSDLDFIVEHACDRHGLPFLKSVDRDVAASVRGPGVLSVYAESLAPPLRSEEDASLYLSTILSGNGDGRGQRF